jgi:hypothetical protein
MSINHRGPSILAISDKGGLRTKALEGRPPRNEIRGVIRR